MEDKLTRFNKKVEPITTESKEKVNLSTYKSLIAKIQSKVSQKGSVLKERPVALDLESKVSKKKAPPTLIRPLTKINFTDSRLSAINKSLISRMSKERGTKQPAANTSRPKNRGTESASRDRSSLKERINRLSTLERNLKELELKTDPLSSKKIAVDYSLQSKGGLSLLQKFQIYQVKNQGSERSKSSKEGSASNGTNSVVIGHQDTPNRRFAQGLDLLKKRIAQLPGRSAADFAAKDSPILHTKSKEVAPDESDPREKIHSVESRPININLYKKKVDPLAYKREDQSSLKILKARRSPESVDKRKNHTIVGHSKIRIKDRESVLQ